MTKPNNDRNDKGTATCDDMIESAEELLGRGAPTTTSRLLANLSIVWACVARMKAIVHAAPQDVVTADDRRALGKALQRIDRETEMLDQWLRFTRLEQPRN